MTVTFEPAKTDARREIVKLDGQIVGDITPNACGGGGWLSLFGPRADAFIRVRGRTWPRWCADRNEARAMAREALTK